MLYKRGKNGLTITYADWGDTKTWVTLTEESPENIYYIEEGCPLQPLIELMKSGSRIFKIPGTETKRLRKERGLEKTDEIDVELIRELAKTKPELFKEITSLEKQDLERKFIVGKYRELTQTIVILKNRQTAMEKQFGPSEGFKKAIKDLEADKALQIDAVTPYIQSEMMALVDIKGLGPAYIAQIVALAHPAKFKTQSGYLKYLGFMDKDLKNKEDRGKYNRAAKSVYYNIMTGQMMIRSKYYDMMNEIKAKEHLKTCSSCYLTKPSWTGKKCKSCKSPDQLMCNGSAHSKAQNKVMTVIAKLLYSRLKDIQIQDTGETVNNNMLECFFN